MNSNQPLLARFLERTLLSIKTLLDLALRHWEERAKPPRRRVRPWIRALAVTTVILFISGGIVFSLNMLERKFSRTTPPALDTITVKEVEAALIREDGRRINLDTVPVPSVIGYAGAYRITRSEAHVLVYDKIGPDNGNEIIWNSLAIGASRTPWVLRMPDGSSVSLCGGTIFRYPPAGRVAGQPSVIRGRAFFNVTAWAAVPFIVQTSNNNTVRVLGTSFDVRADARQHEDKVSLYAGAVQASSGRDSVVLKGNGEAMIRSDRSIATGPADSEALGWVGSSLSFNFDNTDFPTAIRQVAAWYGYTVYNPEKLKGTPFIDTIDRTLPIGQVIQTIERLQCRAAYLRINGRQILVSSKPSPN